MKGSIYAELHYRGAVFPISLDFDTEKGPTVAQVLGWIDEMDVITPQRQAEHKEGVAHSGVCPKHGDQRLRQDKKGRGVYCAVKENGQWCGRQSWKGWQ